MGRRILALGVLVAAALFAAWFLAGREQDRAAALQPADSAPESTAVDAALESPGDEVRGAALPDSAQAQGPTAPTGTPAPPGRLHGRVLPAPGRTAFVDEVAVGATDTLGEQRLAHCAADGSYAFEDLAAGRYWLRSRSPEDGNGEAVVDVRGDTLRDIQLQAPRVLQIRVVDEQRRPLENLGFYAVATAEEPGEWIEEAHVGATNTIGLGRFEFVKRLQSEPRTAVIGRLFLDRDLPLHVSLMKHQRVLDSRVVVRGSDAVEFMFLPGQPLAENGVVRLRVVDAETREPLQEVMVIAGGSGSRMRKAVAGLCEFKDLPPGNYRLQLMAKDRATECLDVRVPPGESVDVGDVPLRAGNLVSGRILDETGKGDVFRIRFDPCGADGQEGPLHGAIFTSLTKTDGSFSVTGLAPGFHRLELMAGDEFAVCVAVVDVRNGPVENVSLTVTAGVPFVVDPDGKHSPGARFAVLDEKGVRVVSRVLSEPEPVRVRLAPGRYTVEFKSSREDPEPRTTAFEIVRDPVVVRMR